MDELQLLHEFRAELEPVVVSGRPWRRNPPKGPGRALVPLAAAAVVVVVVAVSVAYAVTRDGGGPATGPAQWASDPNPPNVAAVTEAAARAAVTSEDPRLRRTSYVYTKGVESKIIGSADRVALEGDPTYEFWERVDGYDAGQRLVGEKKIDKMGPGDWSGNHSQARVWETLKGLPTDPDALLAELRTRDPVNDFEKGKGVAESRQKYNRTNARAFNYILESLRGTPVLPAKQAAGMFRTIGRMPEVKLKLGMRDALGRPAVGLVYPVNRRVDLNPRVIDGTDVEKELMIVLEESTYRYVEERTTWKRDKLETGIETLIDYGFVDDIGLTPSG